MSLDSLQTDIFALAASWR